jgi:proteic killer suppression protein
MYPCDEYSVQVIKMVVLARAVHKRLPGLPEHVAMKLLAWVSGVETYGLEAMRKVAGYHDEPLRGDRKGQRSIRLSRSYRAFYTVERDEVRVEYVHVREVNKHEY